MTLDSPEHSLRTLTTRTNVIYIMGAGRSGSTLLGLALGQIPGVLYAGELGSWARRAGRPNFGGAKREAFWSKVKKRMATDVTAPDPRTWRRYEHSTRFLRPGPNRHSRDYETYIASNRELFAAISAESDCDWIVDSSHHPGRALELRRVPDLNVHLVYLTRDPAAVVRSFRKRHIDQPRKNFLAANAYLWLTSLVSATTFAMWPRDRRHYIDHEDLVSSPVRQLARLANELALPPLREDALRNMNEELAFQGNRLLNAPTSLEGDRRTMRTVSDYLTLVLQGPWAFMRRRLRRSV